MKIRSLLLGSVAAAGLSTTGFAADLGVVTSLDICDELGLSGLTISSDDNCLVITGGVTFEYSIGDYNDGDSANDTGGSNDGRDLMFFERQVTPAGPYTGGKFIINNDTVLDSSADVDAWLKFVATANSDFGPASATIKLISENFTGTADPAVLIDEAWVGIGDTTMIMAGYKSSIFNKGDDAPLNYLGLFNSSSVDAGVGFRPNYDFPIPPGVDVDGDGDIETLPLAGDGSVLGAGDVHGEVVTGGTVIQIMHNVGNGLSIGGGLEDLGSKYDSLLSAVGVVQYAGDGISAHVSGAVDTTGLFNVHAGFKGTWDPITVVGAVAVANGWWNALGSASATFDMFTIAVSGEATSAGEWGVGGSVSATVTDGVTLNLGSRLFVNPNFGAGINSTQTELGIAAAVTETITATAAVGLYTGTLIPNTFYGKAGLAWAPGGGFTSSVEGEVNTLGGYKGTFKAAKTIQ
jgi:hypothetical protein